MLIFSALVVTSVRVHLVMTDDRSPVLASWAAGELQYPALAYALNALYACGLGYDLTFYRMLEPRCVGPDGQPRAASYYC